MAILGIFLAVNHKVIPEYPTASNATGIRPCRWAPPAGYTPPEFSPNFCFGLWQGYRSHLFSAAIFMLSTARIEQYLEAHFADSRLGIPPF